MTTNKNEQGGCKESTQRKGIGKGVRKTKGMEVTRQRFGEERSRKTVRKGEGSEGGEREAAEE